MATSLEEQIRQLEERVQILENQALAKNVTICPNCITQVFQRVTVFVQNTVYCNCGKNKREDNRVEAIVVTEENENNEPKELFTEVRHEEETVVEHVPTTSEEVVGKEKIISEEIEKKGIKESNQLQQDTQQLANNSKDVSTEVNDKVIKENDKSKHISINPVKENNKKPKNISKRKHPEEPFAIYKKRKGLKDLGKEYEYMMCALYAIKLAVNENIVDFEMTTNEQIYEDFDDICLKVTFSDETNKKFLLQLKHREDDKKNVTDTDFAGKDDFSLVKYLKSFNKMTINDTILILYTNSPTKMKHSYKFTIQPKSKEYKDYVLQVDVQKYDGNCVDLLTNHRKENEKSIFQFELTQNRAIFKNIEQFSQQFYFLAHQDNISSVRSNVRQTLETILGQDVYDSFVNFIRSWWLGQFVLNKHDVIAKLTELALTPWIKTLSNQKVNHKTEYLTDMMMKFQLTIVGKSNDISENIWPIVSQKQQNLSKAAQKYMVSGQENKILWYLGIVPLVVKVNDENMEKVTCALRLLEKNVSDKKIVVVGDVSKEKFPRFQIFENLSDILDDDIHNKIVTSLHVSIQGRSTIPLQKMINCSTEMVKSIGVAEMLQMSQEDSMLVGLKEERNFTEFYIPRSISLFLLNTEETIEFCSYSKKCVLIINCNEKFKSDFLPKRTEVTEIDIFLNDENPPPSRNLILFCVNRKCTLTQFQKISDSFDNFNIYSIQIFNDTYSTLQFYSGRKLPLFKEEFRNSFREKITFKQKSIPEEDIFAYFDNHLNVFCAPPGMGKSTLLQILSSTYCPPDFCSIHVNLINHNLFLKTKPNNIEILRYFMNLDDTLISKVNINFSQNGRMHLFLDGLDEVESEVVDLLLDFAKDMSSVNIHVWISSRENLYEKISQSLNVIPIEIEELNEDQRRKYIHDRLAKEYKENKIQKITDMIFKSADVTSSQQLLGIPLQLYIITEVFLTQKEAYETLIKKNIFILTKMYRIFFDGKKEFLLQKSGLKEKEHQIGINFDHHLKQYEVPALKSCLDSTDFDILNLNIDENKTFIENIKTNGDRFGIIKKINNDDQIIFVHQTFAEYFACVWFNSHLDRLILLKDRLFSERYQNLKLIFDIMMAEKNPLHLAVIYKNIDQFNKHITSVKVKDKAGRSALHLACSWGMKYPKITHSFFYIRLNRESPSYTKILEILLSKFFTVYDRDKLFNFNCIDYSVKSYCLYPIEKMLETKKLNFNTCEETLYEQFGAKNLAHYSAQLGYPHLFTAVIEKYPSFVNDETFGDFRLLGTAINGSKNDDYTSPRQGNIKVIQTLIKKGADVNITCSTTFLDEDGTLLEYACDNGFYDVLQILIDNDGQCTNKDNILHRTALKGTLNDDIINIIKPLDFYINAQNCNGVTPLHITCKLNQVQNVRLLLDKDADVNIVDNDGNNALHYAAQSNCDNKKIIKLLCARDVDINAQNTAGKTALHVACALDQVENVRELLEQEIDTSIVDKGDKNALHCAAHAMYQNKETLDLLMRHGFDINVKNKYGKTPLHFACTLGQFDNVQKLIELGADVNIVDINGKNSLHYAAQSGYDNAETIDLLICRGLDVNSRNKAGQTPLHVACEKGVFKNVIQLIEGGADVKIVDNRNRNAYYYAVHSSGNKEVVNLISDRMTSKY